MKILTSIVLTLLFNLQVFQLIAQNIRVETKSIEEVDNKLLIKYDFIKSNTNQYFKVILEIKSSAGIPIAVKSLSGDFGDSVQGGINKQIVWDYNNDGIILQEDIHIEIIANLIQPAISTSKAILLSAILPGWGMSKIEKKPYWLLGIAGYGSLGASFFLNNKANSSYNEYIENSSDELNDELFSKSQQQNQLSKTFAYTAIGIWSVNLIWTAIKVKRNNQKSIAKLNNKKLFLYTGIDPWTKTAGFMLKYRFHDVKNGL